MNRLAITGSSGYLGTRLIEFFRGSRNDLHILGLDIRVPRRQAAYDFERVDILSEEVETALRRFRPDTIIHGAFAFQPLRDERRMRAINVEGTTNLLRAAAAVQPARLLVISSATAYGAWPDNPVPMDETCGLRARHDFRYAADKTEVEHVVQAFAEQHPEIAVSWVRPALIGGPYMDNYVSRFIFGTPFVALLDGVDTPIQFVHEDDVTRAVWEILIHDGRGPYNVAPPDWLRITDIARATHRRVFRIPLWLARAAHGLAWTIRWRGQESPPGFLYFIRYPWVITPARLQHELGFQFRYSSRETLSQIVRSQSWRRRT